MKEILLLTCLLMSWTATGQYTLYQDAVQGQVYDNPATIGGNASSQVRASYNNTGSNTIGSNSYRQATVYYDNGKELKNSDVLAFGIGAHLNRSGESNFGHTAVSLASAYHKRLGASDQFLTLGTSFSAIRRSLDDDGLRWPSQIDPETGFDPTKDPGEDLISSAYHLGLDLGLMYSVFSSQNQYLKLGVALQNINDPDVSFYDYATVKEGNRLVLSALGQLQVYGPIHIEPAFRYFSQGQQSVTTLGNNFKYQRSDDNSIILGVGYRSNDNYAINAGVEMNNCRAMLIYGWAINTSLSSKMVEINLAYRWR